jgi:hypothetical protein
MHAASRHAKPKKPVSRVKASLVAVAALAGAATAFVFLQGGSAPAGADGHLTAAAVRAAGERSKAVGDELPGSLRHYVASSTASQAGLRAAAARHHHLAEAAAQQQQGATPSASPSSSAPAPVLSSGSGGDAADSPLGVCVRDAEEGGSYAWGPGNGGGAYQFALGTWEHYGGSASAFGSAGKSYQDQIFDNAIAAGGASNWTAYDGC